MAKERHVYVTPLFFLFTLLFLVSFVAADKTNQPIYKMVSYENIDQKTTLLFQSGFKPQRRVSITGHIFNMNFCLINERLQ